MDMVLYALLNRKIKGVASGVVSHSFRQSDKTLILTFLDGTTQEISFDDIPYVDNVNINSNYHMIVTLSDGTIVDSGVLPGYKSAEVKKDNTDKLSHLYLTDTSDIIHDLGVVEGDCVKNFEILTQAEYDNLVLNNQIKDDQLYIVKDNTIQTISTWLPNHTYLNETIIIWDGVYYITKEDYTSGSSFNDDLTNDKVEPFLNYIKGSHIVELKTEIINGEKRMYCVMSDGTRTNSIKMDCSNSEIYKHTQTNPSNNWHIQHNLKSEWYNLTVRCVDQDNNISYGNIDTVNSTKDLLIIEFDEPIKGFSIIKL